MNSRDVQVAREELRDIVSETSEIKRLIAYSNWVEKHAAPLMNEVEYLHLLQLQTVSNSRG